METRRDFIKKATVGVAGLSFGGLANGLSAWSYGRVKGSNDKIRVGVIGFSDRFKSSLFPSFMNHAKELNFEFVALSDIWRVRREAGQAFLKGKTGWNIAACRNNDELYERNDLDAVIISTADFQHALHLVEAAKAKKDAYVEKPFAETMNDANEALEACHKAGIVVQIGSQRRSGANYKAASEYIDSGTFGDIAMVEMCWNVNQPGRWRRPKECASIREEDVDWIRYQMNRPKTEWNPRKYLEYRLFWPYSSGIPGQWMCHQIDTVHWFTHLPYPRSVVANGGIYQWADGRTNADTLTAVFDYGPADNSQKGFQVVYSSRFSNGAGGTKELYYSNGGMLNLDTNEITPTGGLQKKDAAAMGMAVNLLEAYKLPEIHAEAGSNTGGDLLTSAHMRNWMECVKTKNRATNCPVEAGYSHAIACGMANAAYRTGVRVVFDEQSKQILAEGNPFQY
ncbi:MAG: Gfo/Idh/MocA family oxidoreductase [Massilibacteroides sp.]|nr:Gfo/Idh/MocA family oxidoreductase [Massilibacteroides sp.]MDD4661580.1 Gfo/Idh/MocA family oxidoreductase [Massilibacteroides sp.]